MQRIRIRVVVNSALSLRLTPNTIAESVEVVQGVVVMTTDKEQAMKTSGTR